MLSFKHLKFIDEYMIDFNASQAAIRAGYSPKSAEFQGCKLLAMSKISQEIKTRQEVFSKKVQITREELIDDLVHIKNKQKDAFPPSAIAAIKEIAKMLGLNEPDKIEHSGNLGIDINVNIIRPNE